MATVENAASRTALPERTLPDVETAGSRDDILPVAREPSYRRGTCQSQSGAGN